MYGQALEKNHSSATDKESRAGLDDARGDKAQAPRVQQRTMDDMSLPHPLREPLREDVGCPPSGGGLMHRYANPSAGAGGVNGGRE